MNGEVREDCIVEMQPLARWANEMRFRYTAIEVEAEFIAVASELEDNPGPSVTNLAEEVWTLVDLAFPGMRGARRIEHYPRAGARARGEYDVVTFLGADSRGVLQHPDWRHFGPDAFRRLVGWTFEDDDAPEDPAINLRVERPSWPELLSSRVPT